MALPILIIPCWLYHPRQGGKIFRTREEHEAAHAAGFRDSPAAAAAVVIEAMPDDGVAEALEAAEDAIEGSYERPRSGQVPAQKVVAKKRKK